MAETLVNKNQAGEGLWTADNLIAGTDISITQVPQPLIDENTLGVWHFENNLNNAVSGSSYTVSSSTIVASNSQYKFGNYSLCSSSGSTGNITLIDQALPSGDFTVDYWLRTANSSPSLTIGLNTSSDLNYGPTRQGLYINQNSTFIGFNTMSSGGTQGSTSYGTTIETSSWHHIAMVRESNTVKYYLDGVLQSSKSASSTYYLQANFNYQAQGINYVPQFIDELRLSNIARWTSDFTPYTEPYAASAGPTKYAINNTKADPDLSSYLQNTATGVNAFTVGGTASTTAESHNVGDSSSAAIYGTSCGYSATAGAVGTAIGTRASAGNYGVAIGSANGSSSATTASGSSAIAIGYNAKATANTAIQIGTGTNATAGTVQINSTQILDANGKIPAASLDTAIPAAQVNSDWDAVSGVSQILNKPTLATVATSGSYNDLSNTPTIPTVDQTYSASSANAQSGVAVASAISTKADTDLGNVSATGKATAIGWNIPDYTAGVDMTLPFTCPSDGVVAISSRKTQVETLYIYINGVRVAGQYNSTSGYYANIGGEFIVNKNDVISADANWTFDVKTFFPCKGAN